MELKKLDKEEKMKFKASIGKAIMKGSGKTKNDIENVNKISKLLARLPKIKKEEKSITKIMKGTRGITTELTEGKKKR